MKFRRNTFLFAIITVLTISVVSLESWAQTPKCDSGNLLNQLAGNSIEGVWRLNAEESDDVIRKIQTLLPKLISSSNAMTGTNQEEIPTVSISLFPPEELVLVKGKNVFTINETFQSIILTRTLATDGVNRIYQAGSGVNISAKAKTDGNILSMETTSPRGNLMSETFELLANGDKLKVTIKIVDSIFQEILSLEHIYDRAILDDLLDYN